MLSARLFDVLRSLDGNVAEWVTDDLLSIHDDLAEYEAARVELIQRLVDALWTVHTGHTDYLDVQDAIDAAKAAGFKPSDE